MRTTEVAADSSKWAGEEGTREAFSTALCKAKEMNNGLFAGPVKIGMWGWIPVAHVHLVVATRGNMSTEIEERYYHLGRLPRNVFLISWRQHFWPAVLYSFSNLMIFLTSSLIAALSVLITSTSANPGVEEHLYTAVYKWSSSLPKDRSIFIQISCWLLYQWIKWFCGWKVAGWIQDSGLW